MREHEAGCPRTPCSCKSPVLIGIVHLWIRNVRITGYQTRPNEYMPPGTVGDMEVIEVGNAGKVINARFHPGGEGSGYGLVINPNWEHLDWREVEALVMDGKLRPRIEVARCPKVGSQSLFDGAGPERIIRPAIDSDLTLEPS